MPPSQARDSKRDSKVESFPAAADRLVTAFRQQRPLRTGSLVVSIFGDAISPHGGAVWLGSLINVLQAFGINQRLVRTSVFRLVKDGWLQSEQIGRRSYYRLSTEGRARFQDASRRIYSEPRREWAGNWCLVLLAGVEAERREEFRKELGWLGFAPFSPGILAHPAPDLTAVQACVSQLDGNDRVLITDTAIDAARNPYLKTLVHDAWSLQELDDRYGLFLEKFRSVYRGTQAAATLAPAVAFRVRTLLVHEYRKTLLRDPFLPIDLLPAQWNGLPAYQLCRNLYKVLAQPSLEFLTEHMETADGPLPPAEPAFFQRFGGLDSH